MGFMGFIGCDRVYKVLGASTSEGKRLGPTLKSRFRVLGIRG